MDIYRIWLGVLAGQKLFMQDFTLGPLSPYIAEAALQKKECLKEKTVMHLNMELQKVIILLEKLIQFGL